MLLPILQKKSNLTFKYSIEPAKKDKISHVVSKRMGYDSWLERKGRGTSLVPCGNVTETSRPDSRAVRKAISLNR